MLSGFKGIVIVLDDLLKEWQNARSDFSQVLELFKLRSFETVVTKMNDVLQTLFYWNAFDTSNMLISELIKSTEFLDLSLYFVYPLILLIAFLFYVFFIKEIRKMMVSFYAILLIIPFRLIESNLVMVHHLHRVRKGERPIY